MICFEPVGTNCIANQHNVGVVSMGANAECRCSKITAVACLDLALPRAVLLSPQPVRCEPVHSAPVSSSP